MKKKYSKRIAVCLVNLLCVYGGILRKSLRESHTRDGHLQLSELRDNETVRLQDLLARNNRNVSDNDVRFRRKLSVVADAGLLLQPWQQATTLAPSRKGLHFRPVSMTLWCVMILTIESLFIYTGLALLRNADELSARPKPSLATETFAAASRTSVFPSMLCMLFVGFRMYVLATTEGLGEPQIWAKACMCAATIGLTVQFLIIFALPLLTKTPAEGEEGTEAARKDGKTISTLTGGHHDVHPMLEPHDYHDDDIGDMLQKAQILTMVLVYGGVLGVLIGVATFPRQNTQISAAVLCTCIMSLAYFSVYLYVWCVRTYTESKMRKAEERIAATEAEYLKKEAIILAELKGETLVAEASDANTAEMLADEPWDADDLTDPNQPKRELSEATIRCQTRHRELLSQIESKHQLFQDRHKHLVATEKARRKFVGECRAALLTKHDVSLKGAAMNMSMSVKKAPMLAILFLAARMRALQVDPPYGMPPFWAQCCFVTITVALVLECVCAAFIGYTGKERKGYYGTYLYRASREAHVAQHACAFVMYVCLVPVVVSIFRMGPPGANEPAPLSPTVKCVLYFQLLYFGIAIGQWCTFFAEDVLDMMDDSIRMIQQTILAAGVSVTFTPMLCVLFVATRMRALQITQQLGNPPDWAQDCMFMCVFATFVQVFCCLLMPIFTGDKAEVDEDGNAKYELSPMVGAYFVTVIKYLALFMLHGGVITICVAVFIMTPETCMEQMETAFDVWKLAKIIAIFSMVSLLALLLSSAKVVGLGVKFAIESLDDSVLGTQIQVKAAALSVLEGYVDVQGLSINNPPVFEDGVKIPDPWSSDCLASTDKLTLKINVWRLISTLGKEIEITAIVLRGFQFNYDKWSLMRSSNVDMILAHMQDAGIDTEAPPPDMPDDELIEVLKVNITKIAASGYLKGVPLEAKIADIDYENFSKETGGTAGSVGAIFQILLKSILLSIVANFANVGGGLISGVAHGVEAVAMAPIHGVAAVAGAAFGLFSGSGTEEKSDGRVPKTA